MGIYSKDLRIRAVATVERGIPTEGGSSLRPSASFCISLTTLKRWLRMNREGKGILHTGHHHLHGKKPTHPLNPPTEEGFVEPELEKNDDATLERHCELWEHKTGVRVSI